MQTNQRSLQKTNLPDKNNVAKLLRTNPIIKIAEIVIVFVVAFAFIRIFEHSGAGSQAYNMIIIGLANILMLLLVWLGLWIRGERLADLGLTFKKFDRRFAVKTILQSFLVMLLAVAGFIIGSVIMANITGVPEGSDYSGYNYLENNFGLLLLALACIYIISSFGEEVIYRAFLITRITQLGLNNKTGKISAVIISAVVFGLVHYRWGPMGMVQTGFMGLALASCYLFLKKRIWVLVLAHAYMDTILLLQVFFK